MCPFFTGIAIPISSAISEPVTISDSAEEAADDDFLAEYLAKRTQQGMHLFI